MYYQLPNGKVIQISIEDYLDMTDQDIQMLMSVNAGDHIYSPFHGSVIKQTPKKKEIIDKSIDFSPDDEEKMGFDDSNTEEDSLLEDLDLPDQE